MTEKSPLNIDSLIRAIGESRGLPGKVCRLMGCTLHEFTAILNDNEDVRGEWELAKEETRDQVEEKIIDMALAGNPKMIEIYAKANLADRGYNGEKQEEVKAPIVNLIMQKPEERE